MPRTYVEKILRARVYDVAVETPLEKASRLSARVGNQVLLKREDTQQVFSFKLRGAYNKIYQLTPEQRDGGVIAASAGNHAQGVALAGQRLGVSTTIVMPVTTPAIKVETVRRLGGRAVLQGDSYDEAFDYATRLAREKGLTFIHPFDDPDVIAGQGTVGMEMLRQHADPIHAVFVPVGGGGCRGWRPCGRSGAGSRRSRRRDRRSRRGLSPSVGPGVQAGCPTRWGWGLGVVPRVVVPRS